MENIEAMLCAYIEGDLDAAGKSQIEKHLKENPQHRKLLDELMSMRDLVRGLPRAEAPMDLEDSLRQKVERSMLLDNSVASAPQRQRADWWPQFFTIAAIFLLFASLCFILIKTLGPTLKPAVFTQNVTENIPPIAPADRQPVPDSTITAAAQPQSQLKQQLQYQLTPTAGSAAASPVSLPASTPPANAIVPSVQQLVAQSQQQVLSVTGLDLPSIRRRLENSGYGVTGAAPGGSSHSVLMVVNSTDPPTTNAQITQFLNSNTGISWKAVPSDSETRNGPTTLPSSAAINARLSQAEKSLAEPLAQNNIPATEPSSDLYVARGLTAQQADALRLTLTVPQNGPEVQVEMRSAQPLATTQPTILSAKDDGALSLRDIASSATTQPAETANSAVDLNASPTTAPSVAGGPADARDSSGAMMANNASSNASSPLAQNKSQILLPVDAVIVLQSGTVVTSPTTQPALGGSPPIAPQMKLLSPVAVPSTQP